MAHVYVREVIQLLCKEWVSGMKAILLEVAVNVFHTRHD